MISYTDELYHHGIKGQKWGVRRYRNEDGSLTEAGKQRYAENYSNEQRIRDRKIYGRGAERRINNRMLKGESIQSARHNEVVRKGRIDNGKAIARNVAKGALVIGGAATVAAYLQKKGFGNSAASGVMTDGIVNIGRQVINGIFR